MMSEFSWNTFLKKKHLENKNLSNLTQQKEMKTTVKY